MGQCCPKATSCPSISPHSGSLERSEVRGRALEPLCTQVQARDGSPLASGNTGCVCACVQVWVYVCAYFAHLSKNLGVGSEEVGKRRMPSSISSGGKESEGEAGWAPTGGISVLVMGWGSAVLRCPKCWRDSVYFPCWALPCSEVIVEGCPKFVF